MKETFWLLTKITSVITLIFLCFILSCQKQAEEALTEEEVKTLNGRISEIFNEGNVALVDELYTPEVVRHDCGLPEYIIGLDALKNYFTNNRTTFPDMNMTIEETIVKGDKIVWRWTITGTNTGSMGEIPPTGKKVRFSGVSIALLVEGKMAEIWDFYNQAALLQQLGFTITPPQ